MYLLCEAGCFEDSKSCVPNALLAGWLRGCAACAWCMLACVLPRTLVQQYTQSIPVHFICYLEPSHLAVHASVVRGLYYCIDAGASWQEYWISVNPFSCFTIDEMSRARNRTSEAPRQTVLLARAIQCIHAACTVDAVNHQIDTARGR